jgi:hypothetical protein
MGLHDRTHWWISCDAPSCNTSTADDWNEPLGAEQNAINMGFKKRSNGTWICDECDEMEAWPLKLRQPTHTDPVYRDRLD